MQKLTPSGHTSLVTPRLVTHTPWPIACWDTQTLPIACWDTHTLPIACSDTHPPPVNRMTERCKNITLPQLHLQAVKITSSNIPLFILKYISTQFNQFRAKYLTNYQHHLSMKVIQGLLRLDRYTFFQQQNATNKRSGFE